MAFFFDAVVEEVVVGGGWLAFVIVVFDWVSLIHLDFYANLVILTEGTLLSVGFKTNTATDINSVGTSASEQHIHRVLRLFLPQHLDAT